MVQDNIIASIPGSIIAQALDSLPKAATSPNDERDITISVPDIGWVQIYCTRVTRKWGRSPIMFWAAVRAIKLL